MSFLTLATVRKVLPSLETENSTSRGKKHGTLYELVEVGPEPADRHHPIQINVGDEIQPIETNPREDARVEAVSHAVGQALGANPGVAGIGGCGQGDGLAQRAKCFKMPAVAVRTAIHQGIMSFRYFSERVAILLLAVSSQREVFD